jgi:hydrogenase maturation protein HypF
MDDAPSQHQAPGGESCLSEAIERRRISIFGMVQGVGFRPFVQRLAQRSGVAGFVRNTSRGVMVEAEGEPAVLDAFCRSLNEQLPPLAEVVRFEVNEIPALGEHCFTISQSSEETETSPLVPADAATCEACLRDFTNPRNRRYGYPFTNCTHCGPRYSIIQGLPFDRPTTTMVAFTMCAACQAEYDNPEDRRFHAQPNACAACGPSLALLPAASLANGEPPDFGSGPSSFWVLQEARYLLKVGRILAIKGLGGFQLACDARNDSAVHLLRERKHRTGKPFALMARDLAVVEGLCVPSETDREALSSPARPIVIMSMRPGAAVSPAVAPNNNTLAVMLPYTPLHHLLFAETCQAPAFDTLVVTSGNLSEEPIVSRNEEAWPRLGSIADWFLIHNRDVYMRVDDSVVRTFEEKPRVLRRSRGYVPHPLELPLDAGEVLGCGAEIKNTFCLTKGRYAIVSQHIGDLENYETLVFFQETLANLKKLFRIEPRLAAFDLHPLYLSSRFAMTLEGVERVGVQHHHAHIASCMVENGLCDKVIGVAFDGTGYGTDGRIWGGEFLISDFSGFERHAHLRNVTLAGGDAAVRQPWRVALSYIHDAFGSRLPDLPLWEHIPPRTLSVAQTALRQRLNTFETSSCGRLFDAVASILNLRHVTTFEGQAAMELEMAADEAVTEAYPFAAVEGTPLQLDLRPTVEEIVREVAAGRPVGVISARFHNTLANAITEICRRLRKAERLNRVCLSGGTFQNMLLLKRTVAGLRDHGFEVFLHRRMPPNDGGISLGQAVIASELSHAKVRPWGQAGLSVATAAYRRLECV